LKSLDHCRTVGKCCLVTSVLLASFCPQHCST